MDAVVKLLNSAGELDRCYVADDTEDMGEAIAAAAIELIRQTGSLSPGDRIVISEFAR